jgi:hypothetical protein
MKARMLELKLQLAGVLSIRQQGWLAAKQQKTSVCTAYEQAKA